jgi:hypothetical protein
MAVNLSMLAGAGQQFLDNNANPLSGGKLYSYAAGTTTPQTTYTSSAGNVARTNPIILDSAGRVPSGGEIWLTDSVNYKFVLNTSSDVLLATWDNVSGNGSGIYAALAAPSGSSLVGFLQQGAGAVPITVEEKLQTLTMSLVEFGGVCDGVTDDLDAWNAAIAQYKITGIPISFSGFSRVSGPLVYQTSGTSNGLSIIGTGSNTSGIIGDFTGDALIEIDGSSLQAFRFQYGGGFSNFQLTTATGAVIKSAISVNGWWNATHENLLIGNSDNSASFTEHGITIPLRTDIDSNPDGYATVVWTLNNVTIRAMGQNGIVGFNNQGYAGWTLNNCISEANGTDGIQVHCAGWIVTGGSCSYNGRYGVNFSGESGVTLSNGAFDSIELDGNGTAGIFISRVSSGIFNSNRIISRVLDAVETSLVHVWFDSAFACLGLRITNTYHRVESGMTSAVTIYYSSVATSNISGNEIDAYNVLNSGAGTVTNFSSGLLRPDFKNIIANNTGESQVGSTQRFAYSSETSQNITTSAFTILNFNTAVQNTGWQSAYDTGTGRLTIPYNGFYLIAFNYTISVWSTNTTLRISVYKNASANRDRYYRWNASADAPNRFSVDFTEYVYLAAGDIIDIRADVDSVDVSPYGTGKLSVVNA